MFRLNRMTEYALIALRQLHARGRDEESAVLSARELAEIEALPFEVTAKTLQRLRDAGYIQSAQGVRGGYVLARDLGAVSFSEFIEAMEEGSSAVECCGERCECEYQARCGIKPFMVSVNRRVRAFLDTIALSEMITGADR